MNASVSSNANGVAQLLPKYLLAFKLGEALETAGQPFPLRLLASMLS